MTAPFNNNTSNFISLLGFLNEEKSFNKKIAAILDFYLSEFNIDGVNFFVVGDHKVLTLQYMKYNSINFFRNNADTGSYFAPIFISDIKQKRKLSIAERCLINNEIINVANIAQTQEYQNHFFEQFDSKNNYITTSVLAIPLTSKKGEVIGILQFINPLDKNSNRCIFSPETTKALYSLSSLLSHVTECRVLTEDYDLLLESFIGTLTHALEAKSPYTGLHCQRVPVLARLITAAAVEEKTGALKDFTMSESDWYALHIASWLHDCGKITTPEFVVDKATKLETVYNRIHEIRNRFEILRRDAHIDYLKKRLKNTDTQENLQKEFIVKIQQLEDDFDFIAQCNIGDKELTDEEIIRLEQIAQYKFTRHFSRMKGLSWAERDNVKDKELYSNPCIESLIQNRDDHRLGKYNLGELYNLSIPKGTINKEEREKINEHIVVTIDMLKTLPFPKELSNIVEYAGAHHERVDGKGYPNHLTGEQMSVPAKAMAIADIFEALTASDRPYKEPKKLSEALRIMQNMKNTGHIDPALYKIFIENEIYNTYAYQYLKPEQIDEVNPGDYL